MSINSKEAQRKLLKREHQRLYKQQYRVRKKAIDRIERERALGLATLQAVPMVAVPENLLDQHVYDVGAGVNVLNAHMVGEGNVMQEVLEVEASEDVIEDEFEFGEPLEEGELAHSWLSVGVNAGSGDFDTEYHTDKESDSESDREESLSQFLINWNSRHNITREAMKDLLGGLRVHNHPDLPLDPRTLLRTNLAYSVEDKCGGSYVYLSLAVHFNNFYKDVGKEATRASGPRGGADDARRGCGRRQRSDDEDKSVLTAEPRGGDANPEHLLECGVEEGQEPQTPVSHELQSQDL